MRARRTAVKGGALIVDEASGAPAAASPHDTTELRVYVDGKRMNGTFLVTGERKGDAAVNAANQESGKSPGYARGGVGF